MKLFKDLFIKINIVVLLLGISFTSRAGFTGSVSDYVEVSSKIITSVNNLTTTLGGVKDDLVHESLKQILAGITTLKLGKIGAILNIFLSSATNWNWIL